MEKANWEEQFRELYQRVESDMRNGKKGLSELFKDEDRKFLDSIGSKPIEVFDAVDDWVADGVPSFEEILEIHRMRYRHFVEDQSRERLEVIPTYREKSAELEGVRWLPRAIDKARAKYEGRLDDAFFYPCGGDRNFLKRIKMGAVDFFRVVNESRSDEEIVLKLRQRGHLK